MEKKNNKTTSEKVNVSKIDFSKLDSVIGASKKDSIYKNGILSGTEKERKTIRRKLRARRDKVIEMFNNSTTREQKKQIAQVWQEFAKDVYKDINVIFDANTTDDKVAILATFVADVKKVLA